MNVQTVTPQALYEIIQNEPQTLVIDVRTAEEFEEVHIINAISVPLSAIASHEAAISLINKLRPSNEQLIYVTCATGKRATLACAQLAAASISGLILVEGGTKAWIDEGLPVKSEV